MPFIIGGAISGLGSLASGIFGSSAATDAAKTQADAARFAAQLQFQMFQQMQGNVSPFLRAGTAGLTQLQRLTGTGDVGGAATDINPLTGTGPDGVPILTNMRPTTFSPMGNVLFSGPNQTGVGGLPSFVPSGTPYGGQTFQPAGLPYGAFGAGGQGGPFFSPQGLPFSAPGVAGPGSSTFAPTVPTTFTPTMDQLRQFPGYQFALDQGLRSVTNQNAALGLGSSGALGKGLVNYAEGLATTTETNAFNQWLQQFQNQYNMFTGERGNQYNLFSGALGQQYGIQQGSLANQYNIFSGQLGQQYGIWQGQNALALQQAQQIYNMLGGISGSGQNAAVNLGTAGLQSAGQAGNLLTSGAAATAGGIVGSANALMGGLSGATGAASNALITPALLSMLSGGGGAGAAAPFSLSNLFGGGTPTNTSLNYLLGASAVGAAPGGAGAAGFGGGGGGY